MKKTISLFVITLLFTGYLSAQVPDDLYVRVIGLIGLSRDTSNEKLRGFIRNEYFNNIYEMRIEGSEHAGIFIYLKLDQLNREWSRDFEIADVKEFNNIEIARNYKEAYIKALEKYGFVSNYYNLPILEEGNLIYDLLKTDTRNPPFSITSVFISEKLEKNGLIVVRVSYLTYNSIAYDY